VEQWPQAKLAATYQAKCYTRPLSAPTVVLIILLVGWLLSKYSTMFKVIFDPRIEIAMTNNPRYQIFQSVYLVQKWTNRQNPRAHIGPIELVFWMCILGVRCILVPLEGLVTRASSFAISCAICMQIASAICCICDLVSDKNHFLSVFCTKSQMQFCVRFRVAHHIAQQIATRYRMLRVNGTNSVSDRKSHPSSNCTRNRA
jgi:hypothetical protein